MNAKPNDRSQSDQEAPPAAATTAAQASKGRAPSTPDSSTLAVKGKDLRGEHGVELDTRGQDQPTDKKRAQQTSKGAESGAAQEPPPSPGQPAEGE
jgi:hypothetical protein